MKGDNIHYMYHTKKETEKKGECSLIGKILNDISKFNKINWGLSLQYFILSSKMETTQYINQLSYWR